MSVFDFDADDLLANRNRYLTLHQVNKLRRMRIGASLLPVSGLLISLVWLVNSLYEFIARPERAASLSSLLMLLGLLIIRSFYGDAV